MSSSSTPKLTTMTTGNTTEAGGPKEEEGTAVYIKKGFVVREWKVLSGSVVQKGDVVAIIAPMAREEENEGKRSSALDDAPISAMNSVSSSSTTTTNAPPPVVKQHRRPRMRNRKVAKNLSQPKTTPTPFAAPSRGTTTSLSSTTKAKAVTTTTTTIALNTRKTIQSPADGILRIRTERQSSERSNNDKQQDDGGKIVLGRVVPCTHPAVLDNLCAVCGKSVRQAYDSKKAYLPPSSPVSTTATTISSTNGNLAATAAAAPTEFSRVTVSGGITMTVSGAEARSMSEQNRVRLLKERKLSLVLDLDHTLVHATADPRTKNDPYIQSQPDVRSLLLPIVVVASSSTTTKDNNKSTTKQQQQQQQQQNQVMDHIHYIKLRPHVMEFLTNPRYEMSVYTAGTRLYAEQVTMILSRHMVGAKLDHTDIIRLQYEARQAQEQYDQEQKHIDVDGNKRKKPEGEQDNADDDDDGKTKRRKVTFGEVKLQQIGGGGSNQEPMTRERLQSLQERVSEAKKMEDKALDLRQRIFGSRIFSRTDVGDLGRDVKSLKRIFPCGGTMAVVVDDREDVWANAEAITREPPHNLLLVKPYHWKPFTGFANVNNEAGIDITNNSSNSNNNSDKENNGEDKDQQLLWTKNILERLYDRFYANEESQKKPVWQHLQEMRQEILDGTRLVLSGLVPLHRQSRTDRPRHHVIRHVQNLGAQVRFHLIVVVVVVVF